MTAWNERAACLGASVDLFFPTRVDTSDAYLAAAFCDRCPIAAECLRRAWEEPRTCGVRGGMLFDDGHAREIGRRPHRLTEPRDDRRDRKPDAVRQAASTAYWYERDRYPSDRACHEALGARYGVTRQTLRTWTVADAAARQGALL